MNKLRFWIKTNNGKVFLTSVLSVFITTSILLLIFLPILLTSSSFGRKNSIIAYNRDSTSGTREGFENSIQFNSEYQQYSKNVLTVSGNSDMIEKVSRTSNSIGYVSLFSVLEKNADEIYENMYDEFYILSFEGESPIDGIENNMENYIPKRHFNLFFRVDQKYNNFIFSNMYGSSSKNLWTENGNVQEIEVWSQFKTDYFEKPDSITEFWNFIFSFVFINWITFSSSVYKSIDISLSENDPNFQQGLVYFFTNLFAIDNNYENDLYASNSIIYTAGSSSVSTSLSKMFDFFKSDFNAALSQSTSSEHDEYNLMLQQFNSGSGEAFSSDDNISSSVKKHIWLGFQSRNPSEEEMAKWGQKYEGDENSQYLITQNKTFLSFEIDAIAFIINKNFTIKDNFGNTKKIMPTNITALGTNLIYTENYSFQKLYGLNLIEGIEI